MNKSAIGITVAVSVAAIVIMSSISPIAQDIEYHNFVDKRPFFGIPNFGDVVSNIPFIIFGLMGLHYLCSKCKDNAHFTMQGERLLWKVFFLGATLVGFGSGYYHLDPNNNTLVWDRIPMTIAFMSFFSLVIMERIGERVGFVLFPVLLIAGIGSVLYWDYTESLGRGDLRPYALVQFLPLLLIPLMLWLFPARYSGIEYLGYTLVWYALAKLLEHFDGAVFGVLGDMVSGHTLKHLAAAMGVYTMLLYVRNKKVLRSLMLSH